MINRAEQDDRREVVELARPFIRSVVALILHLRFGRPHCLPVIQAGVKPVEGLQAEPETAMRIITPGLSVDESYERADAFLSKLDQDLK